MSYKNIKEQAKAAVQTALETSDSGFSSDFKSIQIIRSFSNSLKIDSRRITIGASAIPNIVGAVQIGWMVNVSITAISNFNKWDEDDHESICSPIEALIFSSDLATRLTNASFITQVATPAESSDDFTDDERITEYNVELDCLLTGS